MNIFVQRARNYKLADTVLDNFNTKNIRAMQRFDWLMFNLMYFFNILTWFDNRKVTEMAIAIV